MEEKIKYDLDAIEYIAKIADGGMRDAITLMDKCLSYSKELTLENVVKALGVVDYSEMFELTEAVFNKDRVAIINLISKVYMSGADLKLFVKNYFEFILDVSLYNVSGSFSVIKIPNTWKDKLNFYTEHQEFVIALLNMLTDLQSSIKWEQSPKSVILANFMLFVEGDKL